MTPSRTSPLPTHRLDDPTRLGERVFRHAGGCLIEGPDLPTPPPHTARDVVRWAATLWPDPARPDGWAALEWQPAPRGWWLPGPLAIGDIIEFGTTWPARRPPVHRWYGWLDHATPYALIVVGPYPHPGDAHDDARPVIDALRLDQLPPPTGTPAGAPSGDAEA